MLEIERVERAAPVLDALHDTWKQREVVMKEMYANKARASWAKSEVTKATYAATASEMGQLAYDLDEAMSQWVQWLLSRKLVSQADIYRIMDGLPTSRGTGGPRTKIINAGRDAAKERRPQNLVEAPAVPEHLKNRIELAHRVTEVAKAGLLRTMYDAREAMRRINRLEAPRVYAEATEEFRRTLIEVWDLYPRATLMRVCKTSANGWLEKHYEAGQEGVTYW